MTTPLRRSIRRSVALPAAALAVAAVLALAACGGGRIGKQGDIRLVNAGADAGALDLYAGESGVASGVAAGSAGGYASVDAGSQALSVRLTASGAQIASTTNDISKDKHYTLLAYSSAGAPATALLDEDESAPGDGSAKVRVFNAAAADAGSVDAYLSPSGCTALGTSNAITKAAAATVGTYALFGAAAAGTAYHLCVTAAGDPNDLRLDLPAFTLASRQVTTIVLTGTSGGVLVDALVVDQQAAVKVRRNPSARVRIVADAAGGATVGVAVNAATLFDTAPSPSVGTYALVPAGNFATEVRIGGVAVTVPATTATPGADLTLLVAGSAAAPSVVWLADDNRPSAATAAPAKLRLVHGINGLAGRLTLQANTRTVASGIAFPGASTPANVAAAVTPFVVSTPGSAALYTTTTTSADSLASGGVYTLFMLGDAGTVYATLQRDR